LVFQLAAAAAGKNGTTWKLPLAGRGRPVAAAQLSP